MSTRTASMPSPQQWWRDDDTRVLPQRQGGHWPWSGRVSSASRATRASLAGARCRIRRATWLSTIGRPWGAQGADPDAVDTSRARQRRMVQECGSLCDLVRVAARLLPLTPCDGWGSGTACEAFEWVGLRSPLAATNAPAPKVRIEKVYAPGAGGMPTGHSYDLNVNPPSGDGAVVALPLLIPQVNLCPLPWAVPLRYLRRQRQRLLCARRRGARALYPDTRHLSSATSPILAFGHLPAHTVKVCCQLHERRGQCRGSAPVLKGAALPGHLGGTGAVQWRRCS